LVGDDEHRGGAMNRISEKEKRELPQLHSDLRLMELADRNPSLGGRELMREILERGPIPEQVERPEPKDIRSALKTPSLDDPDYRTPAEQADWIGSESKMLRDLYERGAEVKGDVLIIPAEPHELPEDRERPFISSLPYALQRIADAEKAAEFHSLAQKISGDNADARTQIVVYSIYYDRLNRGAGTNQSDRDEALAQTLEEMRNLAAEMEKLETRESIEAADIYESRNDDYKIEYSDSSRKVRLSEESLRFPAGLPYETRERLVTITIPEVDRRIESGIPRAVLFAAIDGSIHPRDEKGRSHLTEQELNERFTVASFLKRYIEERLHDPETRALNSSAEFRHAQAEFIKAETMEELGRTAENFLRENQRRSEELRSHQADPARHPQPAMAPLGARERNLLFNGRAPDHHTSEMRELRINYGLSRAERAAQAEKLHRGLIEPSAALNEVLGELETRRTVKAISHFQASLLNEQMNLSGRIDLNARYRRIPPHERTYLFELTEGRKRSLLNARERKESSAPLSERALGAMPKESASLREYLASMGQIERRLLNAEAGRLGITVIGRDDPEGLTITEARSLLPERTAQEIRAKARNQAWEGLAPPEAFDRNPPPEAVGISDAIARMQEQLQEKARVAQNARNEFLAERIRDGDRWPTDSGSLRAGSTLHKLELVEERRLQSFIANLSQEEAQKFAELDFYASRTREEVYRGFEAIDQHRSHLGIARAQSVPRQTEAYDLPHASEILSRYETSTSSHSGQLPLQRSHEEFALNEQHGDEPKVKKTFFPGLVDSGQEWHFDSLREVLNQDRVREDDTSLEPAEYQFSIEDQSRTMDR